MTGFTRSLVSSALAAVVVLTAGALPALARSGTTTTGNDISWPQCGGSYPAGQAFGIVGVNHGLANNLNSCLASELSWAARSTGSGLPTGFPKAALYVNTADPGSVVPAVADWPTSNVDPNGVSEYPSTTNPDPYGACTGTGTNNQACAWQYGWNRAIRDMLWLVATPTSAGVSNLPSTYWWWLDVETGNTWESGSSTFLANNVADLAGMVAAFRNTAETTPSGVLLGGKAVGIYSTSYQWGQITSSSAAGYDHLAGLPDWIPGARTLSGAQVNCSLAGFTTVKPTITQWFGKPFDGDVACP
ncbi:MAG TPA: hypothetical protein VIK31_07355 [Propionibacteriaceae bacterium]|jgi:hypothetical protein